MLVTLLLMGIPFFLIFWGLRKSKNPKIKYPYIYCSIGKYIILSVLTCGVWYIMWIYRATKFLNITPDSAKHRPSAEMFLCTLVPFYQIYWFYKHAQKVDLLAKAEKRTFPDISILCLIFAIFLPIVASIIMQDKLNDLCLDQQKAT